MSDGAGVGYLELLGRNRDFRRLWLGQVVSQLGDWFDTVAVYTLVLGLTGSGRAVGLVLVTRFLPTIFLGPLAGVLADRYSRRTIMIASDLARAFVVLGFLLVRRPEQLWIVYALTLLQLALSTFFEPAKSAAIPSIVTGRALITANAISSVTWSVMLTLGAAVGGEVAGRFGTDAAFVLDSLTYLASAALIFGVRLPRRPPRPKTKLTLRKALGVTDTVEGARYVRARPHVLAFLLVKPAWGLGGGILTLLTVFGDVVFPIGQNAARGMGVLYAVRGVGTAVGPVLARRVAGDGPRAMRLAIGFSFIVGGLFYIGFGVATNFALALLLLGIAHAGGSTLWVYSTTLLQRAVEDDFRGRVFAAELALITFTLALSNYATGEALDRFRYSPRTVAVAIGVIFILPGLVWFAAARWWYGDDAARRHARDETDAPAAPADAAPPGD
jgi:MFS family permease